MAQVSSIRRIVHGVEICLTRWKDCGIMLATTISSAVKPVFTCMDVMYEVATDESSGLEALNCNDCQQSVV